MSQPRRFTRVKQSGATSNGAAVVSGYGEAAPIYVAVGWPVLPLPPKKKYSPPAGYTGADGIDPRDGDIARWRQEFVHGNVAVRMPEGVIGIDLDAYGDKHGGQTLIALESELGPLPPAHTSTARYDEDNVSGIRFYRVPAGVKYPGQAGPGIEIVQRHHRYAVVWPSIHPDTGKQYLWFDPDGYQMDGPPNVADLVELSAAWEEKLRSIGTDEFGHHRSTNSRSSTENWSPKVTLAFGRITANLADQGLARHDVATGGALELAGLAHRGHPGADEALDSLGGIFTEAILDRANAAEAEKEWNDILTSARKKAEQETTGPSWEAEEKIRQQAQAQARKHQQKQHRQQDSDGPAYIDLLDFRPAAVTWMWLDRIPRGELIVLEGRKGTGKSTLASDLAVRVAIGEEMPDGMPGMRGNVLYLCGEESLSKTVRRRVEVMLSRFGAELEPGMFLILRPSITIPDDLYIIARQVEEHNAKLLVIDVLDNFLSDDTDTNSNHSVRRALRPVAQMAQDLDVTVIALRHLRKAKEGFAIDQGMGSVGIGAQARSIIRADYHPEKDGQRVLAVVDCNQGPKPSSWGYQIVEDSDELGRVAVIDWTGPENLTADDLAAVGPGRPARESERAEEWLSDLLDANKGKVEENLVTGLAKDEEFSLRTLRRVKKKMCIESVKEGRTWFWARPKPVDASDDPKG
jgi:hypothetical protein